MLGWGKIGVVGGGGCPCFSGACGEAIRTVLFQVMSTLGVTQVWVEGGLGIPAASYYLSEISAMSFKLSLILSFSDVRTLTSS